VRDIYPNGATFIVRVDAQLETTYLKGHINDEGTDNADYPDKNKNPLQSWLSKIGGW
jgi:hypothetical protein